MWENPYRMAIKTLTYLDIPSQQRRSQAASALNRVKERLNDPTLDRDQRVKLMEQMAKLNNWASDQDPNGNGA